MRLDYDLFSLFSVEQHLEYLYVNKWSNLSTFIYKYKENKNDDDEWQFSDENSRKVRSTITNNHSTILKAYYNFNPRPKRADIIKISEQIGMYYYITLQK